MSFSTIEFYPGPRVVSIVLNRPPMNVIDLQMLNDLHSAWDEVEGLQAQVVVISGAGDTAFSAGVDIADHMIRTDDVGVDDVDPGRCILPIDGRNTRDACIVNDEVNFSESVDDSPDPIFDIFLIANIHCYSKGLLTHFLLVSSQ